jgi:hypothetical protein
MDLIFDEDSPERVKDAIAEAAPDPAPSATPIVMRPAQPHLTERRMVGRLLAYWHERKGERRFPRLTDIEPDTVGNDWRWAYILDTAGGHPFPNFVYLGPSLCRYAGVFLGGKREWATTLLDKATSQLDRVLAEGHPRVLDDEVRRYDGARLMFRAVLLPLSDDGITINYVLGAANGKLVDQGR